MGEDGNDERLDVFGSAVGAAFQKCHGLRGAVESLRSTGRDTQREEFRLPRTANDFESVRHQGFVHTNVFRCLLHLEHVSASENRAKIIEVRGACFRAQNLALGLSVGISHAHAHQEAVELRFG